MEYNKLPETSAPQPVLNGEKIANLLRDPKIKTIVMHRVNYSGHRLYVQQDPFQVYSGLTGALGAVQFKGNQDAKRITKWRDKMIDSFGQQQQEAYLNSTADFGTLVHGCIVRIWENGYLNWRDEQEWATEYFKESALNNHLIPSDAIIERQVFEYCKAAASLMAFIHERVVEIYAVESMCKTDELSIATPIDIVALIKDGKKSPYICTINVKTSSQLNNHHREQVSVENALWNTTYPKFQANHTALLRPKDWHLKKEPTYEFEVLDPEVSTKMAASAFQRLAIAQLSEDDNYLRYPREQVLFTGETKLGDKPELTVKGIEEILFGR